MVEMVADIPTIGIVDACVILECSDPQVRSLVKAGKLKRLPKRSRNSPVRITLDSVNEYAAQRKAAVVEDHKALAAGG